MEGVPVPKKDRLRKGSGKRLISVVTMSAGSGSAQPFNQGGRHIKPQIYGKIAGPRTPAGRVFWSSHRLSWFLKYGDIPPGMLVDHKCHNTLCVNPSHLRLVTPKQNSENREVPLSQGTHLESAVLDGILRLESGMRATATTERRTV